MEEQENNKSTMYDIPLKASISAGITTLGASAAIITDETLVPLGVYVGGIFIVVVVAWRLSTHIVRLMMLMQKFEDQLEDHDKRLTKAEMKLSSTPFHEKK